MALFSDYIFADESGDHGLEAFSQAYPVFVLAFTLIHKDTYRTHIVPSLQKLKMDVFGHDQIVLHERDIRKQLPPFGFMRTDAQLRTSFWKASTRWSPRPTSSCSALSSTSSD